jgi:serine protease AprX
MNSSCFDARTAASPVACLLIASVLAAAGGSAWAAPVEVGKMDPGIARAIAAKSTAPLRVLIEPLGHGAKTLPMPTATMRREDRLRASYDALSAAARRSQAPIVAWLRKRGIAYRTFTVVDAIAAELTPMQLRALARRDDVRYLADDAVVRNRLPGMHAAKDACNGSPNLPWGVARVNADDVWALGARGAGVVVGGQDTGYDFDHPALLARYRGNGTPVQHDYHWHDAIHTLINGGVNSCGINLATPCDDNAHGTHTMGTMVGASNVGVAPDAQWIGCRNMEEGDGTPSTYLECFDWFLAPTTVAGTDPDPTRAPHIINNSWGCPTSEGCTSANWGTLETAVNNLTAAGILVVVSAGNDGSACGSVNTPAAIFANSLTVAWTTSAVGNTLSSGSSRGPVTVDGSNRIKPDIAAPGSSICSTIPGTGFSSGFSGTSMAGPHVAGVAALLMSAFPGLKNDPPAVRQLLTGAATPLPNAGTCGGIPGSAQPNPFTGYGLVDALAAYQQAQVTLAGADFDDGFE